MMHSDRNDSYDDDTVTYEVEFKGARRDYYICPESLSVKPTDYVIVQADRGEHLGRINRCGPRSMFPGARELRSIIRHASYTDLQIVMDNKGKEDEAFVKCQEKIEYHNLKMKLVDVEYQFDGNKICFFFTADKRIDFRALVKDLAAEYRTRIELRQIGVRDEARRLGGIGVCGRTLCCKTFLDQFEPITSQMARDQNLSLSPSKISGLCGRLMCCLAYEENFYKDQADLLPDMGTQLEREGKRFEVVKIDLFNETFVLRGEDGNDRKVSLDEYYTFKRISRGRGNGGRKCPGCGDNTAAQSETTEKDGGEN